jgi:hypothetical protein
MMIRLEMPRIRITCVALVLAAVAACGGGRKELRAAKTSGYQADFAIVYSEVLAAVTNLYPHLVENAAAGVIKTQWHPMRLQAGQDSSGAAGIDPNTGLPASQNPFGVGAQIDRTHFFIRFDVLVVGGDPWRVRVTGYASKWEVGYAKPVPLDKADEPHWLQGRIDKLQVAIYRRLEQYAVPLEIIQEQPAVEPVEDLTRFGELPEGAAAVIAVVERAARTHDVATLRRHMIDDFVWSLGATPGADQAIAMWQADTENLRRLVAVIEAGCVAEAGGTRVVCPPEAVGPSDYVGHRAAFEVSAGAGWKLIHFVSGD